MKLIEACDIGRVTGADISLIYILTHKGYIQPINLEEPYMYPEDSIQKVLDYMANPDDAPLPANHEWEIRSNLQDILRSLRKLSDRIESLEHRIVGD